jgi:phenylacetic acid degradation operon negative regulatory protein
MPRRSAQREHATLSAPDLILALVDSEAQPDLSVAQLIAAGALFDIDARAVRVALTRLARRGVLVQLERGRYGLGAQGGKLHAAVRTWSTVEDAVKSWSGGWLAVHTGHLRRNDKTAVRARERALRLRGFVEAEPGLWLRPDNLIASAGDMHSQLVDLGLDTGARLLSVREVVPAADRTLGQLWNCARLERGYRRQIGQLEKSRDRLGRLSVTEAARETLQVGRAVTAAIVRDPLLPEEMLDVALRRRLNVTMRDYNRLGRAAWRAFYASI